jgi:outer membrane protein TolC
MRLILALFFIFSSFAQEKITLKEDFVINSALKHYPDVLQSIEDMEASKAQIKEALGAFDLKLKAKGDIRTRGFYNGKSMDVVVEKPLQFFNSRVYTGFRQSEGKYPDYEGKNDTLTDGESRFGVEFSLLQDRAIDERRLKLRNSKLGLNSKEMKFLLVRVKINKMASKAYWTWVAKGNIVKVYQELLDIAIDRNKGLKSRVRRGDLAKIYMTENRQYILKRETQLLKSKQEFFEAALELSLFLRDEFSSPIMPQDELLPEFDSNFPMVSKVMFEEGVSRAMEISPKLRILDNQTQEFRNEQLMGENKLMPRLDLSFEVSRDTGIGSSTLIGTENRAMLKLEIPLERNLGKGKVAKSKAKRKRVEYERKLQTEMLKNKISNLFNKMKIFMNVITNTQEEVQVAQKLQKAEVRKFANGASDFFVVNLREQNTADAKIKLIKAKLKFKKNLADYDAQTFNLLR